MAKSIRSFPNKAGIASGLITASILLVSSFFSFLLGNLEISSQIEFQGVYLLLSILVLFVWGFSSKKGAKMI